MAVGSDEPLYPEQSFEHTLKEISVNRDDPCELVRELVSNAYDASASLIRIFPLHQAKGLLFFDNGIGLSDVTDTEAGVSPYVAFFSIGKGTKTRGSGIGYKCQGSKLSFASGRFSLITRCGGETDWRWITIDNPKSNLNPKFNVRPQHTSTPWDILRNQILQNPDQRTREILAQFDKHFFQTYFDQGTLLVMHSFEVDSFERRFSTEQGRESYLYNYIRFYTAHSNIRWIDTEHGFQSRHVNAFKQEKRKPCKLQLWMPKSDHHELEDIPPGWPYLPIVEGGSAHETPEDAPRLRDGTFQARFADTFKYGGQSYYLVLAIDGNRHALKGYKELSRKTKAQGGIRLADQRGILLCSHGLRVCDCNDILEQPVLDSWLMLTKGRDHFVFLVDGSFELVTNRNAPAPEAAALLRETDFLQEIRDFLDRASRDVGGPVLTGLLRCLSNEADAATENQQIRKNEKLKKSIATRDHFLVDVPNCQAISSKWLVAPDRGEEHFVGAIYTLFAHIIPSCHEMASYWPRPLTFAGIGIDALATDNENAYQTPELSLEYKYSFSTRDCFNHPFSLTDVIVCWEWEIPKAGDTISDDVGYSATVERLIECNGRRIGLWLNDVRRQRGGGELHNRRIRVLCLRELLDVSFGVTCARNRRLRNNLKSRSVFQAWLRPWEACPDHTYSHPQWRRRVRPRRAATTLMGPSVPCMMSSGPSFSPWATTSGKNKARRALPSAALRYSPKSRFKKLDCLYSYGSIRRRWR